MQNMLPSGAILRAVRQGRHQGRAAMPVLLLAAWLLAFASAALGSSAAPDDVMDARSNQVTAADQHEPTLAVDPTNPNNVLVAAKDWRTGPKQVWYYRSTDGGRTWLDGHADTGASELPNASDPVLAFDATGTAYLAYIGYNQNDLTVGGIFVARSTNAGQSWEKPVLVAANDALTFHDKEWIAVDRSNNPATRGTIYVSWTLFKTINPRSERGDIVVSRSTDGGKSYSTPVRASLPAQDETQGSFPAIGPNGELYVLYYSDSGGSGADGGQGLFIAKSTDGGASFAVATRVSSVSRPPSPLPGSAFRIFVLPVLAVDPNSGALYATWNDSRNGDSDVMLARSTNGGATWTQAQRINDDPARPRHDQFFPTIAVGRDGVVHLLWLDRRDDAANNLYLPYYATSTDGGVSFTQEPLSRTPSDPAIGFQGTLIGDYISLDTSFDGSKVYAAWVDTRNGDQDIYFSAFGAKAGPESPPPAATRPAPAAVPSPQPLTGFFDAAFLRKWQRTDRPVLLGRASRPWVWGPVSFAAAREAYAQGRGGVRAVQYFDKARMEINDPGADLTSRFFVTNGLLVVELVSGSVQTGNNEFEAARPPAQIPVAGDSDSPDALTYASLVPVASLSGDNRAADRTGQQVNAILDRSGATREDPARAGSVRIARYEPVLGHNIPSVFWDFMN
ncbi:MAG TPA: sialidase family protein, partial [Chloroflexia bacterium]|nr:sialidase family protein [Chloroflexia bacterium]